MAQTNILLESGTNELEIVEFYLDEAGYRGHYGVNVAKVIEILREQPVTSMPEMSHPSVMGAFRHRDGKVIPMVDLMLYLEKSNAETEPPKVIVTEFNNVVTGFRVSGVNRIHRMSWEDVEPPTRFLDAVTHNAITGVVRVEGRVVFILDLEAIVGDLDPGLKIQLGKNLDYGGSERHYTILHADDSGMVRNLVKALLEGTGRFTVLQTDNGHDAWDILKTKRNELDEGGLITDHFHGVISDIEMPRMDGHNLCKRIKEDPKLRVLPVALFSSLITEKLRHKGDSVGADDQFAKPDLRDLAQRMVNLIESKLA